MRARLPTHRNRRAQMTITSWGTKKMHSRRLAVTALVIIATGILAHGARAQTPVPAAKLTTAPVPTLTTVVVDGSSAYDAARLFAVYREQLGPPLSRETARLIVAALLALYEQGGSGRRESKLGGSRAGRGGLGGQLCDAKWSAGVYEGERGRYGRQLEEIVAGREVARMLRKDDVPDGLR